jgi:GrpB-like predicted nucleotidyltransferase (UPF0157 family)
MVGDDPVDEAIDERIELREHDPRWSDWFVAERDRILRAAPSGIRVEHFGSTAVPDLLAKPIIDILVGVAGADSLEPVAARLIELGYESLGEAGVPGRVHLRRRGVRSFNISVVSLDTDLWRDNVRFRDHLRTNRDARERYAEAKQRAIDAGHTALLDYSDFKSPTVEMLIADALNRGLPG